MKNFILKRRNLLVTLLSSLVSVPDITAAKTPTIVNAAPMVIKSSDIEDTGFEEYLNRLTTTT